MVQGLIVCGVIFYQMPTMGLYAYPVWAVGLGWLGLPNWPWLQRALRHVPRDDAPRWRNLATQVRSDSRKCRRRRRHRARERVARRPALDGRPRRIRGPVELVELHPRPAHDHLERPGERKRDVTVVTASPETHERRAKRSRSVDEETSKRDHESRRGLTVEVELDRIVGRRRRPDARDDAGADQVGLRGPLGNNWPLDRAVGRDLVIVTGGIDLSIGSVVCLVGCGVPWLLTVQGWSVPAALAAWLPFRSLEQASLDEVLAPLTDSPAPELLRWLERALAQGRLQAAALRAAGVPESTDNSWQFDVDSDSFVPFTAAAHAALTGAGSLS